MLYDTKKDCIRYASLLGDYQAMGVNELADGYCLALDTNDSSKQNSYLSALILRFWYTIDKMYKKSANIGLDHEDFFSWLVEAINYACKYRAWQNPDKKTNAQASINQCINTIRLQHYYEYNLDKHRANYNTISFEAPLNSNDENQSLSEILEDESIPDYRHGSGAEDFVQRYINNKKLVEAIILDCIAFNNAERITKTTVKDVDDQGETIRHTQYTREFWPYKLVQILGSIPDEYPEYFANRYKVSTPELSAAVTVIKKANNQKLYKYISKTLEDAKHSFAGCI